LPFARFISVPPAAACRTQTFIAGRIPTFWRMKTKDLQDVVALARSGHPRSVCPDEHTPAPLGGEVEAAEIHQTSCEAAACEGPAWSAGVKWGEGPVPKGTAQDPGTRSYVRTGKSTISGHRWFLGRPAHAVWGYGSCGVLWVGAGRSLTSKD
jgi:hypothetical protein